LTLLLDRHDSSADTIEKKKLLEDFQTIIAVNHENYKIAYRSREKERRGRRRSRYSFEREI